MAISQEVKSRETLQKWVVPIKRDEKTAKSLEKTRSVISAINKMDQAQALKRGRVLNTPAIQKV